MLHKYTSEFRYNLKLATPVILGMLGHTFVGLIDNIMVGQLGTAQLAAVSLGNSFIFIAIALGIGFSTAITPIVAEADAAEQTTQGCSAFKHGMWLCTILGAGLTLMIFIAKPLMYAMKQPVEVVELAMPYLNLVALSLFPLMIFQGLKQFSDGLSVTKYPMYATLVGNVVNVILNYVLIFGKLGFQELGIIGAAYGTFFSRLAMVGLLWYLLLNKSKTKHYVSRVKWLLFDSSMLKKIINLGTPSALQMLFEVAVFTAAIWLSGTLGKNPQAANQIALNLSSMTFMVAMGLSVAAMIRVGNQKGLLRYGELRRIGFSIFLLGLLLAFCFAILFFVGHKTLPLIYLDQNDIMNLNDNKEVLKIASKLMLVAAVFQLSDSLQVVALGALRGLQDVKIPTVITFISYWIIGFPISFYLGQSYRLGSMGIWIGLLSGLTAAALFLFIRFNYLTKRLILQSNK